jgi:ABC-2 type transport system ATP-binding protein
MHRGRLVSQGTIAELRAAASPRVHVRTSDPERAATVLRQHGLTDVAVHPDEVVAELGPQEPEVLLRGLVLADIRVRGFSVDTAGLEDVFLALTGEGFDVSA